MTEKEKLNAFYDGVKEGIWKYAYYKDGVQYVGTTGKTLKEAWAEIDRKKEMINKYFD